MQREDRGYHSLLVDVVSGAEYAFSVDCKKPLPDPASRFQSRGVHQISRIVDPQAFLWSDEAWRGFPKGDLIIYEIHVGTYTREGTFEAIIPHLDYLKKTLGVTAIELMPVGQFPGSRNWGYDGVFLYAPQNSYGGPSGLKMLVNACHKEELAVILDVVYNHAGPEGNCLDYFGPYFSHKYWTPWGPAFNYDDFGADEVRSYVLQNVEYWVKEYHMDGFRLDAIHRISDSSPKHILLEISATIRGLEEREKRPLYVIAESDLNDPRILLPRSRGGYEIDAQWSDDFHHSVHSYLTGESFEHYLDYGSQQDIAKALNSAFVFEGKYSRFRGRTFGTSSQKLSGNAFLSYIQNHDQVGNRPDGARLSTLLEEKKVKLAIALMLLSQSIPFLFMGEEYAESAPFHYFVSHGKKALIKMLRKEKRAQFARFSRTGFEYADPQDMRTFELSKLDHSLRDKAKHRRVLEYYRELIHLRKNLSCFRNYDRDSILVDVIGDKDAIVMKREGEIDESICVFVLRERSASLELSTNEGKSKKSIRNREWFKVFDSANFNFSSEKTWKKLINSSQQTDLSQAIKFPAESVTVFSRSNSAELRER